MINCSGVDHTINSKRVSVMVQNAVSMKKKVDAKYVAIIILLNGAIAAHTANVMIKIGYLYDGNSLSSRMNDDSFGFLVLSTLRKSIFRSLKFKS